MRTKKLLFLFIINLLLMNCSSEDSPRLSSENKITSLSILVHGETFVGNINNNSKEIIIQTSGLELVNSIVPNITISENATITPDPNVAQNFNQEVSYIVTSENGDISTYKVKTENTPFSDEKKILSFDFSIDNETFVGNIDHNQLYITIETYKDISNLMPIVRISDNATITPEASNGQDFTQYVQYSVTAQNGSSNTYTVYTTRPTLSTTFSKCYIRATSVGGFSGHELRDSGYDLYLENTSNSYKLNYFDLLSEGTNEAPYTSFSFEFDENIVTANDYILRMKIGNQIIAETEYTFDVLAEGAPKITSINQTGITYDDTLIMYGTNLFPQIRYYYNFNIYNYFGSRYVTLNAEATILELKLNYDRSHFGSSRPIRVSMFYNDRYADSEVIIFI